MFNVKDQWLEIDNSKLFITNNFLKINKEVVNFNGKVCAQLTLSVVVEIIRNANSFYSCDNRLYPVTRCE